MCMLAVRVVADAVSSMENRIMRHSSSKHKKNTERQISSSSLHRGMRRIFVVLSKCIDCLVKMVHIFPGELKTEVSKVLLEMKSCDRADDYDYSRLLTSVEQKKDITHTRQVNCSLAAKAVAALQEVNKI